MLINNKSLFDEVTDYDIKIGLLRNEISKTKFDRAIMLLERLECLYNVKVKDGKESDNVTLLEYLLRLLHDIDLSVFDIKSDVDFGEEQRSRIEKFVELARLTSEFISVSPSVILKDLKDTKENITL